MVTRSLFGCEARAKGSWCERRYLNPHGPCGPTDFSYYFGFYRRHLAFVVWTIPSPCPGYACSSDLVHTPVDRKLDARDVTGIVGCQEDYGFRNFVRRANTAQWNTGRHLLGELINLRGAPTTQC